ncbi:hypothetical protein EI94DRAFT_1714278 [Lactarius quietus]|nr:hypothetical protein EI94DRAFT_1727199 [Lactarius quietus]KAF8274351.1 hypothetical protein EI94DRAFT_1714278 [Lactarius quietus]
MNPTQTNSRERLQQTIDAEIKSLEESVRALKLRRNALSPVSSLPPEVFAAIFSLSCLPGKPGHHLVRLRVSHVCHQWREIALNQSLLWSHVDFAAFSLAGVAEMLVRARSVPLYFETRLSSRRWDDARFSMFQKEVQARIPHIYHLSISAELFHLHSILEGLVSPAPTLEYLSLFSRRGCCACGDYGSSTMSEKQFVPDTLFDGSVPRLSYLQLCNCDISWKSPLLKDLKYLEIRMPSEDARPEISVWLAALDQMPQLKTLTLHSASPVASRFPFDVERTITLPFLTKLDISASHLDCALALAHLDLPALTFLCLTATYNIANGDDVQQLLPYITRHAHGPQDTQPLQSLLIREDAEKLDILAWPVPNIDVEVHNPPALLGTTLPTRVALAFRGEDWNGSDVRHLILDMVMEALPLDGLVMLAAQDLEIDGELARDLSTEQFWLRHSPKWSLLQRVRLAPPADCGFIKTLREDSGGRENPLLPSLTELVVVYASLNELPLCDVLIKRVEQGVPLEMLDLRLCQNYGGAVRLFSEIVVDVLGPEEASEAREQMESLWNPLARGPFIEISGEEAESDTDDDDDDD